MKLRSLAPVAMVASLLVAGCSTSASCDDLEDLAAQLEETSPDDPEYNDIVGDLKQAEADCNSSGS